MPGNRRAHRVRYGSSMAISATLLVFCACSKTPPLPDSDPPEISNAQSKPTTTTILPLVVQPFGCLDLTADRVCLLPSTSRTICLWVADIPADTPVVVQTTVELAPTRSETIDHGQLRCVDIPLDATTVWVRAGERSSPWSLTIAPEETCDAVNRAKQQRKNSKEGPAPTLDEIRQTLKSDPNPSPYCAAAAESLSARLYLDENQPEMAIEKLNQASDRWLQLKRPGLWIRDIFALAHTLTTQAHHYHDAYNVLHNAAQRMGYWPEMAAKSKYYLAVLFFNTGDIRSALELIDDALPWFRRLGMTAMENDSVDLKAQILAFLGRHAEAEALRKQHLADTNIENPCIVGHWSNNSGWDRLMIREREISADSPDPRPLLLEAADVFVHRCAIRQQWWLANIHVNLALAEAQLGDTRTAQHYLDIARNQSEPLDGDVAEWANEVEARIAMGHGELNRAWQLWCSAAPDQDCLPRAGEEATPTLGPEVSAEIRSLALFGRAQIALSRADPTTAERLLLTARDELDEQARFVPLGEGKSTFVGNRSKASRYLAELYVQTGRLEEAARELRRASAQILSVFQTIDAIDPVDDTQRGARLARLQKFHAARATLAEKSAELQWAPTDRLDGLKEEIQEAQKTATKVLDELASNQKTNLHIPSHPPPDELWLLLAPIGNKWGAIWQWEAQAIYVPLPELTPPRSADDLATLLLPPVAAILKSKSHLRVTAIGDAAGIDIHVLPWQDLPLQNQIVVDYWVAGTKPAAEARKEANALIVSDPSEDLQFARQFCKVAASLWQLSDTVPDVICGEHAARNSILEKLTNSAVLVYSGHARKGGMDGRNAAMLVAEKAEISAADLIAQPQLPPWVVLSACEAAETHRESIAPGPGIAQAFLLGGSQMVIAAVRPVNDRCASEWTERLLKHWSQPTQENLWAAYLSASDRLRTEEPECDFGMFRVYRSPTTTQVVEN